MSRCQRKSLKSHLAKTMPRHQSHLGNLHVCWLDKVRYVREDTPIRIVGMQKPQMREANLVKKQSINWASKNIGCPKKTLKRNLNAIIIASASSTRCHTHDQSGSIASHHTSCVVGVLQCNSNISIIFHPNKNKKVWWRAWIPASDCCAQLINSNLGKSAPVNQPSMLKLAVSNFRFIVSAQTAACWHNKQQAKKTWQTHSS